MPFLGYGCDLLLSTDGGSTYNTVGSVQDLNFPDLKATDVKTSSIQMALPWHTFQPGMGDGGTIKFKLFYAKTQYNTLLTAFRKSYNWKIVFSDLVSTASTLVFAGYLNDLSGPMPLDDAIMVDGTIKVSGAPTFTPGT
jgi:hypothetical protein